MRVDDARQAVPHRAPAHLRLGEGEGLVAYRGNLGIGASHGWGFPSVCPPGPRPATAAGCCSRMPIVRCAHPRPPPWPLGNPFGPGKPLCSPPPTEPSSPLQRTAAAGCCRRILASARTSRREACTWAMRTACTASDIQPGHEHDLSATGGAATREWRSVIEVA